MSVSGVFQCVVCVNDPATTEIYTYGPTLSLHGALPISSAGGVEVHRPQRLVHLARGQAIALHPRRIENDADFAVDAAGPADLGHAGDRQQLLRDRVVEDRKSTRLNSSH